MMYARLVSIWSDDTTLYPSGGLPYIDGPAIKYRSFVCNANPVPIFDVEVLVSDPTAPPGTPKEVEMEWVAIGPGVTKEFEIAVPIWQTDDHQFEGDPKIEVRFTDIEDNRWMRLERGLPAEIVDASS
jgi:hypothetical protein